MVDDEERADRSCARSATLVQKKPAIVREMSGMGCSRRALSNGTAVVGKPLTFSHATNFKTDVRIATLSCVVQQLF